MAWPAWVGICFGVGNNVLNFFFSTFSHNDCHTKCLEIVCFFFHITKLFAYIYMSKSMQVWVNIIILLDSFC